jgi:aspartyl-tRNA(Asn)/glutamyl-tRNA(Gln) amidotransferase subunit A
MSDIADMTAVQTVAAIRSKAVSPVEVMHAALDRVEAGTSLSAFITVTAEAAMQAAHAAEVMVMRGDPLPALHGIPYSVKDLTATAGVRTTMGSAIFSDHVPKEDAISVARAKQAGAILIGKTTTCEFGHKQLTEAPIFGLTLNPIDHSVTCVSVLRSRNEVCRSLCFAPTWLGRRIRLGADKAPGPAAAFAIKRAYDRLDQAQ